MAFRRSVSFVLVAHAALVLLLLAGPAWVAVTLIEWLSPIRSASDWSARMAHGRESRSRSCC